ncbi:ABC-2 type transport system ATP-binding protein [Propionibacteriaceae bacterium ES.041]|uniref:ABC transporter ATP-binding protein n=1 Tax=Enemella evansiae TaxID=2016499 RepID=UPI000B9776D7|nr:ATP-binding cassette domain-containing protein [Enemella evansiae]OYO01079.1 ABC transporter [Enemella evansiae]PFG68167.1 ABC-2 type transport system ATP-binding protein [Propionibacteriaceae bacterium ES.041]
MIEIDNVSKRYGSKAAVEGVTFTAKPGRVTGFLGPNGAGKSSTLRILLGLDRATSGTALIDGKPYAALNQPLRTVGAMLDGAAPVPERRGIDHLRWVAQAGRIPKHRIAEVLETVGLTDAAKIRVRKYSLGMKQRLGLATALLGEPRMLVLDEPVNGLDPEGIRTVRTFIRRYAQQGNTVLLSSHLMAEVAETVDDLVIINKGRIIATGPLDQVIAGHATLEEAFFALTGSTPGESW